MPSQQPATTPRLSTGHIVFALTFCLATLSAAVWLFGDDATSGAVQIALMLNAAVVGFVNWYQGASWKYLENALHQGILSVLSPMIILMVIGALIGAWIASGTVPALVQLGLWAISPAWLYTTAMVLCAVTSLAIGSSWTTASTVGVALMGIAAGIDASPAITAGAVISGAYFGDKLSPLSDTTNLAAGITGANLFAHIRGMLLTTVPGAAVALVCFVLLGMSVDSQASMESQQRMLALIDANFDYSWLAAVPPVCLLIMARRRIAAVPTLVVGTVLGVAVAMLDNIAAFARLGGGDGLEAFLRGVYSLLFGGYQIASQDPLIAELFNRGGVLSMLGVLWLVLAAMMMGSMLEAGGYMARMVQSILRWADNEERLVTSTLATGLGINVFAAEQYLAVVLPARMYTPAYKKFTLPQTRISRALEDSATMTSPLIPWNNCGTFMASTLGVATLAYLPFAILNWLSPLIGLAYALLSRRIPGRIREWDSV